MTSSEADHVRSVPPVDAWRLLTTPMSQDEARQAAQAIEEQLPHVDAVPIDPRQSLVLAWDRWGAEMFREALGALSTAGRPVPEKLLQDLDDWLARADPYKDDDEVWPTVT